VLSEVPEDGIRVGAELPIVLLIANESDKVCMGKTLHHGGIPIGPMAANFMITVI
jgi:hypothetical protein